MSPSGILSALLWSWLALASLYQVASSIALGRLLKRRAGRAAGSLPSCTILVPLRDAGGRTEAGLEALCSLGVDVAAGVEDESGEAAAVARRVAARHPRSVSVRVGPAPAGGNRKVANLIRMLPGARGEILIFTDADVAAPPGYLRAVLSPFSDPRVGLVTCPYRSVAGRSLPERLDVILTNAGFLPSVALAERLEGARFALGATVAVRRSVLDEIGGFGSFLDVLADDHALAERVRRAGYGIVLAPILLDHHVEPEGWRSVRRRQVRWARTIRCVRPGGYAGTMITHGIAPAAALAILNGGAAALAIWLFVRIAGVAVLRRPLSLTGRDLLLLPLADAAAFGIYLAGLSGRSVWWSGVRLRVGPRGSIESSAPTRVPVYSAPHTPHPPSGGGGTVASAADMTVPIGLRTENLRKVFTSQPPAAAAVRGAGLAPTRSRLRGEKAKFEVVALEGISLQVEPGEIFGLLGPNGAGKSTTVGVLTTRIRPTAGDAWVGGHHVWSERVAVKRLIGVVPQRPNLDFGLTAREILTFHGAYFGIASAERNRRAAELLDRFRLTDRADQLVFGFSGGMLQRLSIARALVHEPQVLFLDEPSAGLDPQTRLLLWEIVREYSARGRTILLTTHNMEEADALCHRVAIVDHGRIIALGTPGELKRSVPGGYLLRLQFEGLAPALLDGLRTLEGVTEVRSTGDSAVDLYADRGGALISLIVGRAAEHGATISDVHISAPSLENLFLHHTGRSLRE